MAIGPGNVATRPLSPEEAVEVEDIEGLIDSRLYNRKGEEYTGLRLMGSFPSFRVRVELAHRFTKAGWDLVEFSPGPGNTFWIGLGVVGQIIRPRSRIEV